MKRICLGKFTTLMFVYVYPSGIYFFFFSSNLFSVQMLPTNRHFPSLCHSHTYIHIYIHMNNTHDEQELVACVTHLEKGFKRAWLMSCDLRQKKTFHWSGFFLYFECLHIIFIHIPRLFYPNPCFVVIIKNLIKCWSSLTTLF